MVGAGLTALISPMSEYSLTSDCGVKRTFRGGIICRPLHMLLTIQFLTTQLLKGERLEDHCVLPKLLFFALLLVTFEVTQHFSTLLQDEKHGPS